MSVRLRDALMRELDTLRFEPIDKRIRGVLGDVTLIDSTRAMIVWEPKRVVPTYAFPVDDITAEIAPGPPADESETKWTETLAMGAPRLAGQTVLDPSVPFAVRTTAGDELTIRARDSNHEAAAFRPADEALADYVIVDFAGFDAWYEEDERNVGHPRDPFHRIDIVRSRRHVRVEHEGEFIAESSDPYLLFEPPLPVRYYLPPEDVRTDLLRPSPTKTVCAYKGHASYWTLNTTGEDIAWSYPQPLREAAEVTDRFAFFNEHVDVIVDGTLLPPPETPWSRR